MTTGHRSRLRHRFANNPSAFSDEDLLELILTYAIPRRDVRSLVNELIEKFGNARDTMTATYNDLLTVHGVGEQTAILIAVVGELTSRRSNRTLVSDMSNNDEPLKQGRLFDQGAVPVDEPESSTSQVRPKIQAYVNDEIINILTFLPQAVRFRRFDDYKTYLATELPYNSATTRQRRANHILLRFFPTERLDTPLTYFLSRYNALEDLKDVLFYHILRSEPLAARVAEELIWPALSHGRVDRKQIREAILRHMPDLGMSSQKNAIRSILTTYDLLSVGNRNGETLFFKTRPGSLAAFVYVLTSEFPSAGIYSFEDLEQGPMRHWLLWDRDWIHQQIYALQAQGVIAKVSDIDRIRQFSLRSDQTNALRVFFGDLE